MQQENYPSLYQASDKASINAQKNYLSIIRIDLIFMIIGSLLAIYNYNVDGTKLIIYCISGLFLLISLIMTIIVKSKAYEDTWYQGRALAESAKTLTWRYIMCSESFEVNVPSIEVDKVFSSKLKALSEEFVELNKVLNSKLLSLPIITKTMKDIRTSTTQDRKTYYIEKRIRDQKLWYSEKAELNKKKHNFWFWVIAASQFLSLISVVVVIKFPSSDWNLIGLFTTISASALSWLQLKQHQELKQAYTTAAQELNFIELSSSYINTDEELSRFVLDSENAISREHTLWLAQKRK